MRTKDEINNSQLKALIEAAIAGDIRLVIEQIIFRKPAPTVSIEAIILAIKNEQYEVARLLLNHSYNCLFNQSLDIDLLSWINEQSCDPDYYELVTNDIFLNTAKNELLQFFKKLNEDRILFHHCKAYPPGLEDKIENCISMVTDLLRIKNHAFSAHEKVMIIVDTAGNNHLAILDHLLGKQVVSLDVINHALSRAALNGNLEIVTYLVQEHGAMPTVENIPFEYLLIGRIEKRQLDVIKYLCSIPQFDPTADNHAALRQANDRGRTEIVKLLLSLPCYDIYAPGISAEKLQKLSDLFKKLDLFKEADFKSLLQAKTKTSAHLGFMFFNNADIDQPDSDVKRLIKQTTKELISQPSSCPP